jgi:Dienelactone hydrolase family
MSPPVAIKPSPDGLPGAVTDPSRVRGEDLRFAGANGEQINAYLATPAASVGAGGRPAIVVIHDAPGLSEHIKDVTNRFANLGM